MASIFTKIIKGEIPCYKVAENDQFIAFLDAFPLVEGHVLVVPKRENDYIFDLEDSELSALMLFAKAIAKAMDKVFDCNRIGVSVIGLEVPHTHIHLVPINNIGDLNFSKEKLQLTKEEMQNIALKIKRAL